MPDQPATDDPSHLLKRAQGGDEEAFAALCRRHEATLRGRIARSLSARVQRKVSVRDVLQEALLVAHRRLAELDATEDEAFGRWLGKIVEHKTREAVRRHVTTAKRDVRREVTRAGPTPDAPRPGRGPTPSQAAIAGETREAARRAMADLPPHYAEVVALIQGEGLTFREAAERTDRTLDSVKKIYMRALSRLAADLGLERPGGKR